MAEISYISAQMTIMDLTDGTTLVTRIDDNKNCAGMFYYSDDAAVGSMYDPPFPDNIGTGALELTPYLHTTFSTDNLFNLNNVSDIKYVEIHSKHSGGEKEIPAAGVPNLFSLGSNAGKLTLANRWEASSGAEWPVLNGNQIAYEVRFMYKDKAYDGISSDYKGVAMKIRYTLVRFRSGDGQTYVSIKTHPSYMFVNSASDAVITLTAEVAHKGSKVTDFTAANSRWEYFDDAEGVFKPVPPSMVATPDYNILRVTQDQVEGSEVFKFKWLAPNSGTGDTFFEGIQTILDYSDPYIVTMTSLNGDVFKEGLEVNKVVAVRVKKPTPNGEPVELLGSKDLEPFTAIINKYDRAGNKIVKDTDPVVPGSNPVQKAFKVILGSSVADNSSMSFEVTPNDVDQYNTFVASVKYTKPATRSLRNK